MKNAKRPKTLRSIPINPTPLEKVLLQTSMFDIGIIPLEISHVDVTRMLKQLSPNDALAMKRKFRKVWRKLAKDSKQHAKDMGLGAAVPTKAQRTARKQAVILKMWNEHILPYLRKLQSANQSV